MAILLDENTRLVVQGITGKAGSLHTGTMLEYGTKIVAGVRPGAGGQEVQGVLVFNDINEAVQKTGANAAILFVPAGLVKDEAIRTINSGVKLVVIIPEHVPLHDTIEITEHAREKGVAVIGPNTAGLIAPSKRCKIGFVPNRYYIPGPVGIVSRSGTLMYEITSRLTLSSIGQSACIGVGGDPVVGTRFSVLFKMFEKDADTRVLLMIGEIGGTQEEEVAELVKAKQITKPVVAYIAGYSAPKEQRLGHAGALVSGDKGTIENKVKAMQEAGIRIAKTPGEVVEIIKNILNL